MSAVATGEMPPEHSHEYFDRGRAKFTCTLCGDVNVDALFGAWERAEQSSSELYDLVRDLQQHLDEVAPSETTLALRHQLAESTERMARELDERDTTDDDPQSDEDDG